MGWYENFVLPRLINLIMQNDIAAGEREKFVHLAYGSVLEIGIGSGLNLPFYGPQVKSLCGLDPSQKLWHLGRERVVKVPFPVEYIMCSGESIPMPDQTFDTVLITWTLCSIPDPQQALTEMRRVLKPEGQLIFVEHGLSPDRRIQAWQNRLNPLWRRIAGGCHLNRSIDTLIEAANFRITRIEKGYVKGGKPFSFIYEGLAQLA